MNLAIQHPHSPNMEYLWEVTRSTTINEIQPPSLLSSLYHKLLPWIIIRIGEISSSHRPRDDGKKNFYKDFVFGRCYVGIYV